jgi:3'-5' exoribonuclease
MTLFNQIEKIAIKDLKVGDRINQYYKILNINKRTKKNGEPFLTLELMDKTGKIEGKIWNNVESTLKMVQPGDIYKIQGLVNQYLNKKEIKVETITTISTNDQQPNPDDFVEQPLFDTSQLFNEMITILKSNLKNDFLLKLIDRFQTKYQKQFEKHYGAQKIHHAYLGGLLEHTHSVVKLAVSIADHYHLDKELLMIGALFHDIGKIKEFDIKPSIGTTLEGGLVGHILIGNQIFLELSNEIDNFPENLSIKIQHLIVSHHGEKEYGSPEVPKIPEAFALHIIDLLDSKLKIFQQVIDQSETENIFSEYIHTLSRRIHIPENEPDHSGKEK